MELSKDVEIGEHRYRIGRLNARIGAWVLMQVITKGLQGSLTEGDFERVQTHCLGVVQRYDPETLAPMPIVAGQTGDFVPKAQDLQFDIATVMSLSMHVLGFNLGSFLSKNGISEMMEKAGLSSPDTQA